MADFTDRIKLSVAPRVAFDYLSDVANLPRYFDRMTSATPGGGEEVHTTAELPDGRRVAGNAWFRVDDAQSLIQWGSEGPNSYHGSLSVIPTGDGREIEPGTSCEIEVRLHTTRVSDDDDEVVAGLAQTLSNIDKQITGTWDRAAQ